MNDEGCADASFMAELFVEAKGCVTGISPTVTVALVGVFGAGHQPGNIARFYGFTRARFLRQIRAFAVGGVLDVTTAVVDEEHQHGILKASAFFE